MLMLTITSLARALTKIKDVGLIKNFEVMVVDNRDDATVSQEAMERFLNDEIGYRFDFTVIHGHGNVGYGRGHNLALNIEQQGYHLFLNPDVEIDEDALLYGLYFLNEHPLVGLVSPYATDNNGHKQYLCKRYPRVFNLLVRGFMPRWIKKLNESGESNYEMHDLSENEPTVGIPIASGCFMLCRNSVIAEIGGFDPGYFLYFEDFDFSIRLNEVSKIAYLPDMKIKHMGGNAAKKGLFHISLFIGSGIRFFSRHGWVWF